MVIRMFALLAASVLPGCAAPSLVRDNLVPECRRGPTSNAKNHAAACMTAAMYEIATNEKGEAAPAAPAGDDADRAKAGE